MIYTLTESASIIAILFNISILFLIGKHSGRGAKFLAYTLSFYWFINYFLRPLIFIFSRNANIDSVAYDERIANDSAKFCFIMLIINLGCSAFIFSFWNMIKKVPSNSIRFESNRKIYITEDIVKTGFFIGYLSFFLELSPFRNPFSKSLQILISLSLILLIWERSKLSMSKFTRFTLYFLGFFGVIFQSVLTNNSKGILLTPLLVFVSTLELWKVKKRKSTQISFSIILLVILIPTFNFLQSNKLGKDSTFFANRFSEDLPKVLSPFLTLTNRFDQFARVTDAVSAEKGSMGSYSTWISYILKQIQWNPFSGRSQLSFGQQWNQLVTNQSIPGSRLNSVSLAQGMIAEGYVWRGFYSLLIECVIMGYLFSLLARFLDRGALSIIFAFGVVSNMSLFDAGIVSTAGLVSSSLKPTLFVYVFNVLILRGINRSIFRKSKN